MDPIEYHEKYKGKVEIKSKVKVESKEDLSIAYTPGVAKVSLAVAKDKSLSYTLTNRANTIAIVSDGTAVLGLGDIGPEGAMPVMEGKSVLFKEFGNIDAIPLVIATKKVDEIVKFCKDLTPSIAGINLEDISAPRCFEIEEQLQDIGIPVFHDDQHGTAIVVLAALINSVKITEKKDLKIVINGAGAAGMAITKLIVESNLPVKDILMLDSKGIISKNREGLNPYKLKILEITNKENKSGLLADAVKDADVFIGVSKAGVLTKEMVKTMNSPIIFAMANPTPEIMPDLAKEAGASIVGTGRSDFANQINNVLAFPGFFRGLLDGKHKKVLSCMKIAAAHALAESITPTKEKVLPLPFEKGYMEKVADAVKKCN